ncbi:hypothetical protein QYG89_03560 [Bacillus sp. B190/17]|uniref:Bacteriocin immunity protein n=1 Tax=Bacillus lumedeiriae TaxID=3058829 RepID=A0ABW8I5I2_9BACI
MSEKELSSIIYQEILSVYPNDGGNLLQKQLAALIMQQLQKQNPTYSYVCNTVALFNISSLKEYYGGLLRYTFVMELKVKAGQK